MKNIQFLSQGTDFVLTMRVPLVFTWTSSNDAQLELPAEVVVWFWLGPWTETTAVAS